MKKFVIPITLALAVIMGMVLPVAAPAVAPLPQAAAPVDLPPGGQVIINLGDSQLIISRSGLTITPSATSTAVITTTPSASNTPAPTATQTRTATAIITQPSTPSRTATLPASPTPQSASVARVLIPLYSYPPAQWTSVVSANTYGNIDAIINPANGVGSTQSTNYTNGAATLRAGGVGIYGYVYTSYGARSLVTVKGEIDKWQSWYAVNGIFIDEASTQSSAVPYYAELYNYIKSKGMRVILNPGTGAIEAYAAIADTIVLHENNSSVALNPPSWIAGYPAAKFGALQYSASAAQMRSFVADAKSKNVGYVFVTSDVLPNPWDALPSYLAEEAALLANGVIPSPLPTTATQTTLPATLTRTPTKTPTLGTSTNLPQTATSVGAGGSIRFAVIGDYGSDNANELAVANMVKSWSPDFIITTGDNCYGSTTIDTAIGKYYSDYIGNYAGAYGSGSPSNRFFPSIGNHDYADCGGINSYLNYFTLPNNEYYYDFVKGNVHFFSFDHYSHGGTNPNGETGVWLKAGLAASTSQWNVVYFHASPYTSGTGHGNYTPMQWPFAAWGADVVFSGHEHSYERLFIDGIVYYVNGSGGQNLYAMGAPIPGSQIRYNTLHGAQLVTVSNSSFNAKFYNKSNVLIDNYTISR